MNCHVMLKVCNVLAVRGAWIPARRAFSEGFFILFAIFVVCVGHFWKQPALD